ncbi:MAG: hypothetical protein IPL39_14555 [Opitutaceae bacterium]|nr:hypothetical protein [Opitutaceae bacterium]
MTSRSFLLVLAAVSGTPLLAAGLIACCPSTAAAVIACLALAAGGMLGAVVGVSQISAALPGAKGQVPSPNGEVDIETRAAIGDAIQQLNTQRANS